MFKAVVTLSISILLMTHLSACKDEAKFASSVKRAPEGDGKNISGDNGNPNDPNNPNNTNIGDQTPGGNNNPGGNNPGSGSNPGGGPVASGGSNPACKDGNKPATLTNFPTQIQNCIRGDISTRGMYDFATQKCEKLRFSADLTCTKENLRQRIIQAGMNVAEFDSHATADAVFFSGGCGQIGMPGGHTAIILQFFKLPVAAFDATTCTYNVSGGAVVTGCYITATDNSWASLNSQQKVARCFREAPRK